LYGNAVLAYKVPSRPNPNVIQATKNLATRT
jgi:hypothetical protein